MVARLAGLSSPASVEVRLSSLELVCKGLPPGRASVVVVRWAGGL